MGAKLAIAAFASTLIVAVSAGGAATPGPPAAPVNLAATNITTDSITVTWGPTEPGEFSVLAGATRRKVPIAWVASQDDTNPVTGYMVWQNSNQVATTMTPNYTFSVNRNTKSFRVCVQAVNTVSQLSPQDCGTISR